MLAEVLPRLANAWDITLFALNARKPGMSPQLQGVNVIPNLLMGDIYGREQLPGLLERYQPNVVLLHHDFLIYEVHQEALDAYRRVNPSARVVVYCPIEWDPTPDEQLRTLASADLVVAYTHFGRAQLERALAGGTGNQKLSVIHHGVDLDKFRPLHEDPHVNRQEARERLFGDRPDHLRDAFIVLNANRNALRKRIDLTMRAFAGFAEGRPGAYLYLHMGMRDSGVDISALAEELGIQDRLLRTTDAATLPDVPDEHLNLIYNACDVGINTSTGEGWGLVAFEHAATGAAQIAPDHTACRENWGGRALLVPAPMNEVGAHEVEVGAVVCALDTIYADRGVLDELSRRAFAHATDPRFSWDAVAELWRHLLKEARLVGSA